MTPLMIVKILHCVTIALLFFEFIYALCHRPSKMRVYTIMLTIAAILSLVGYEIELNAGDLETATIGAASAYLGKPFVMVSAFLLVCSFYNIRVSNILICILCLASSFFSVLVFTNEHHHLYYATTAYDPNAVFSPFVKTNGPLYITYELFAALFIIACIVLTIYGLRHSKSPIKRALSIYSILMIISGMLGYLIYLLGLSGTYDSTMAGMCLGTLFLFLMFFRCRMFDVVDKAKDYALDVSADGIVIFDEADTIVYLNSKAKALLSDAGFNDFLCTLDKPAASYSLAGKVYSVYVKKMTAGSTYIGKSVEIHDITESVNYQNTLKDALDERTEKLETVRRTLFGSMANIVEARSLETGDHIKRVSDYTELISRKLKENEKYRDILTDDYINTLVLSSQLHDIGKISIPDTILLKPGKLTPEEFEEMKQHSQAGERIIRSTMAGVESEEYINMAADIALFHHERWDGTGYPMRLKGEEIPLSARIVALADVYDALISERCYKQAYTEEKARSILLEERGTHFDPDVVDAFLKADPEDHE